MINNQRFMSLDAFRGLTIALMILVNTPGSWSHVYAPLRHAPWNGCTPTDLVFPFFLFIVGVAMRFSFKKFEYRLDSPAVRKILGRTATIFVIGLLLNAYPFIRQDWDYSTLRIMGVLQRIALAYGAASLLVLWLDWKRQIYVGAGILVFYWLAMWIGGTSPEPFSLLNNFANKIDLAILGDGHVYHGYRDALDQRVAFDPEGLFSTLPAIVTAMLGYQIGTIIQSAKNQKDNLKLLLMVGAALVAAGWLWGLFFPINKPIWSSSYVLFTGGLATLFLTLCIWLIDIRGWKKPAWPFVIFGTNSIFVFAASGLWAKTIGRLEYTLDHETVSGYSYLYKTIFVPMAGELNGSLLFALSHILAWWLMLYWLDRKKIYIKI
ncbi:MAG: heparan-alpha-glucosaminide N-acetyltransferase domain-containing protein [Candidatus Neomarinimicrobiota bacterium]